MIQGKKTEIVGSALKLAFCLMALSSSVVGQHQDERMLRGASRLFMGSPFDKLEDTVAEISSRSEAGPFQIRMRWAVGACWQGECKSTLDWCIQSEGHFCHEGDSFWVEPCHHDIPTQHFYWLPVLDVYRGIDDKPIDLTVVAKNIPEDFPKEVTYGQIQTRAAIPEGPTTTSSSSSSSTESSYLCLERRGMNTYHLQTCETSEQKQWFKGIQTDSSEPFEIQPVDSFPSDVNRTRCVSTHHHPRQFEEIINTSCDIARSTDSNLWELVIKSGNDTVAIGEAQSEPWDPREYYLLREPRGDPRCRPDATCGMCQGHCQTDDDCAGTKELNGTTVTPESVTPVATFQYLSNSSLVSNYIVPYRQTQML